MCFFKKKRAKKEAQKQAAKQPERQEVKEEPKKEAAKPKAKPTQTKAPEKEREVVNKYHVSQNKDDKSEFFKQWRVRKEGSDKTIKYFKTQKEAIDFATELAKSNDGSVVIHKLDGKVRKQNY